MNDKLKKWGEATFEGVSPEIGQWYWISGNKEQWFGCVTRIGSNYVAIRGIPDEYDQRWERIHFDDFWNRCELEPDPDSVINTEIKKHQDEVFRLMGQVKELTTRLSVSPSQELYSGDETQTLAVRNSGDQDMNSYEAALVKAKNKELPDLFKRIKNENTTLSHWMEAKVIPLQAEANGLEKILGTIKDRIFSVQLYAGLTERVVQILDGDTASIDAKVHLLQRRCYMDEECLARYEVGGMDYKGIGDFDAWLSRPENLNRILPFPRCIVSFQVRRKCKDREMVNLSDFFRIQTEEENDKRTFLYIRNGSQLFRMNTGLEFGEKFFPDLKVELDGGGRLWAEYGSHKIITDNEYQGMKESYEKELTEYKVKRTAYEAALKTPEAKKRAEDQGKSKPDSTCVDVEWPGMGPYSEHERYEIFDKTNVNYDDIAEKAAGDIKKHNQIALIIQGLLDRSPVLHPHPPWRIWMAEGFQAALVLVYDDRTLTTGEKPDFETYRKQLNKDLKAGCVTVGQEDAWERYEGEKESERMNRNWRDRGEWRPTHYRPYGNPGPGLVAHVASFGKRSQKCTYAWKRERKTFSYDDKGPIRTTFTCSSSEVLNISSYKPGDFHQFFEDPRTRAEYLKWAPLLLVAEEYHAGRYEVADPFPSQAKKSSREGRKRYRQVKLRKMLIGKTVRLIEKIETKGGVVYEVGTLWEIIGGEGDMFTIIGIDENGERDANRWVSGVYPRKFTSSSEPDSSSSQSSDS